MSHLNYLKNCQILSEIIEIKLFISEFIELKQIVLLNSRESIKKEIEEVATTDERKEIWGLLDGLKLTTEIAEKVGVSARAVQMFVSQLVEKELVVIQKRGYPKRRVDYIPSDWQLRDVSRVE